MNKRKTIRDMTDGEHGYINPTHIYLDSAVFVHWLDPEEEISDDPKLGARITRKEYGYDVIVLYGKGSPSFRPKPSLEMGDYTFVSTYRTASRYP